LLPERWRGSTPSRHSLRPLGAWRVGVEPRHRLNRNYAVIVTHSDNPIVPQREVHCAEAMAWMQQRGTIHNACAITSLPDVSEMRLDVEEWRQWFARAVSAVIGMIDDASAATFFQSDIRRDGRWLDKGAMVVAAAEAAGAHVLFHKIACRGRPGLITPGRPAFTHVIAVSRAMRCPAKIDFPDVIADSGETLWVRAMGVRAAAHAVRFARDHVKASLIVDPFCGVGTVLAVANALGLDAIGVDRSTRRCEQARETKVSAMSFGDGALTK
jgi:hypothetical protein